MSPPTGLMRCLSAAADKKLAAAELALAETVAAKVEAERQRDEARALARRWHDLGCVGGCELDAHDKADWANDGKMIAEWS